MFLQDYQPSFLWSHLMSAQNKLPLPKKFPKKYIFKYIFLRLRGRKEISCLVGIKPSFDRKFVYLKIARDRDRVEFWSRQEID